MYNNIKKTDRELYELLMLEHKRQETGLELIASENWVSGSVLDAAGSILTNKYAEGYPSARYYGGCKYIDGVEALAIERAKCLFGAEHVNVQPHSGTNANSAVYLALLQPGDTILGMSLDHGGHLTHGSKVSSSGKYYNAVAYGTNDDGLIDYDEVMRIAKECKPKLIIAGASAYSRIIDWKQFRRISDEVGAYLMVDMAHIAGLVACGLHPSPIPYADVVTSTTHKTLRGPRGGLILCKDKYAKKIDSAVFPGSQGGPLEHIIAAKATCFLEAMQPEFRNYMRRVLSNCKAMEEIFRCYDINMVGGGTDNHLLLLDLRGTNRTGKELSDLMEKVHLTANKNAVPNDPQKKTVTSGVRIGTAAITTRGITEYYAKQIATIIVRLVQDGEGAVAELSEYVAKICKLFPLCENLTTPQNCGII